MKRTILSSGFLPIRFDLERPYAIVVVKNRLINVPIAVTHTEINNEWNTLVPISFISKILA